MSILSAIEGVFVTTEADVVALITDIKNDAMVVASDVDKALKWIAGETGNATAAINSLIGFAQAAGVAGNPTVAKLIADAHTGVAALNAFQSDLNAGTGDVTAVIAGYQVIKTAQAAIATASAAVATAPAAPAPAAA